MNSGKEGVDTLRDDPFNGAASLQIRPPSPILPTRPKRSRLDGGLLPPEAPDAVTCTADCLSLQASVEQGPRRGSAVLEVEVNRGELGLGFPPSPRQQPQHATHQPSVPPPPPPSDRPSLLAHHVSLTSADELSASDPPSSPCSEASTEDDDVIVVEEKKGDAASLLPNRSSKRKKVSTLVYVDGHAVKRTNNYSVNATSYTYNPVNDYDNRQHKSAFKQYTTATTTVAGKPKDAPRPRYVSPAEAERIRFKQRIATNITSKIPARQAFLSSHATTLEPFLDANVLAKLQQQNSKHNLAAHPLQREESTVFMQPDAITGDMRDYQLEGLNWMSQMYQRNVGMILGDEMGLGKTLQTIALVCHIKETFHATGPTLVIVPLSVLYSWCNEISKWAPSLKYLRLHASNPEALTAQELDMAKYDIVVTTYEMTKSPTLQHLWRRQHFNLLVLDEGHRIKNRESQIADAVRKLHAENRLILTGTPLANNLVEMWSLLNFLLPDVFTTSQPFAEAFNLATNVVDPAKLIQAHYVLKIFMLRRLKQEVEKLLPRKIETKVLCPLSTTQIWWYKSLLLKDISLITGGGVSKAKCLNNLVMQLRKCCIHPFLFPGAEDIDETTLEGLVGASGKLAVLDLLLQSLYKKGHRVTIFSQFTSVLDILDDYCTLRGWKYCRFDGGTARAKRNYVVNSFNAPASDKFLFLMSTRSGGMGLNLQTADTCILMDSDWNPQPDIQAMARIHRIGQTKTVHVYRLVTQGTVEERMIERAEKKLYLDRMVTRDGLSDHSSNDVTMSEEEDQDRLMSTLRFGCNAIFGKASEEQSLPSIEDIEVITDRSRTEEFSSGNLKGAAETQANDFDATKDFTKTTDFGGIDFQKIRTDYANQNKATNIGQLSEMWKKRQRKNRIKLVDGNGSGYGSKMVPVLASNDYELATGEKSVFDRELKGRCQIQTKTKKVIAFNSQKFCQVCGGGGNLLRCPRCPVSVHVKCIGLKKAKEFQWCTHHYCSICQKAGSNVGGLLFPCSACPNAYCEDHLPNGASLLDDGCERMEKLEFTLQNGVYCHCSKMCVEVAKKEFNWKPPGAKRRDPCPLALEISSFFGGAVDDSTDAPEELILNGRRPRKSVS